MLMASCIAVRRKGNLPRNPAEWWLSAMDSTAQVMRDSKTGQPCRSISKQSCATICAGSEQDQGISLATTILQSGTSICSSKTCLAMRVSRCRQKTSLQMARRIKSGTARLSAAGNSFRKKEDSAGLSPHHQFAGNSPCGLLPGWHCGAGR